MIVSYAVEARRELLEAAAYYERGRIGLDRDLLAEAERVVAQVVRAPFRWREIEGRFQRCLFRRFPYSMIYAVDDHGLFVAAFMHRHRKPGYWQDR